MLLSFSVGNFRSFNEKKTLSLQATSIKEHSDYLWKESSKKILPVITIYGANSSGKSNLLLAFAEMTQIILKSSSSNSSNKLHTDTFALSVENNDKPTFFEASFSINETFFRYGFEYTKDQIQKEWLYKMVEKKEKPLFLRNTKGIGVDEDLFPEGKDKESYTPENRLFLSVVDQLNGQISKSIIKWFYDLNVISGIHDEKYKRISIDLLNGKNNNDFLNFVDKFDLGFSSLQVSERQIEINFPSNIPDEIKERILTRERQVLKSGHYVSTESGEKEERFFSLDKMESEGTKKIINIAGPIYDTLDNGRILVIDELDAKLHPLLTKYIIDLFNSKKTNKNRAQLIFATHDTNLLSNKIMRRDQIWFAEKEPIDNSTDIYPLSELREQDGTKIREDRSFEKDYINGKYGAIPFLRS